MKREGWDSPTPHTHIQTRRMPPTAILNQLRISQTELSEYKIITLTFA